MIELCLCSDRNFVRQVLVACVSCVRNTREPLRFHILLSPDAQDVFDRDAETVRAFLTRKGLPCPSIIAYPIDPSMLARFPSGATVPQASCARLLMHKFIPGDIRRVLYLDGDILVTGDVKELFNTPLDGCVLAGVEDQVVQRGLCGANELAKIGFTGEKYFNSGVLVVDMPLWIEQRIGEQSLELLSADDSLHGCLDQNALNLLCQDRWRQLPVRWNFFVNNHRRASHWSALLPRAWQDWRMPSGILHFPGGQKPWSRFCYSRYRFAYRRLARSIFPDFHLTPCLNLKQRLLMWVPVPLYAVVRVLYRHLRKCHS